MVRLIHLLLILSLCAASVAVGEDDARIQCRGKINGEPVVLVLDTGSELTLLFREAAERLGLEVKWPSADLQVDAGKVAAGISDECLLEAGQLSVRTRFGVLRLPGHIRPDMDGVIGWGCISENIVEIRAEFKSVRVHNQLGIDKSQWLCRPIRTDLNVLVVQIPNPPGKPIQIMIDTGSSAGVTLNAHRWQEWCKENPGRPSTLSALFNPGRGLLVREEKWAKKLSLGGLVFTEVPISMDPELGKGVRAGERDAVVGMCGLSCFSWVVDGPDGKIYIKWSGMTRKPEKYNYNRLAALFVPNEASSGDDLVAQVVENGPAYDAGIRNGDILLKVDDVNATKWRTDPNVLPLSRFWERPAGAMLNLGLKRGDKEYEVSVVLREVFMDERSTDR